MNPNGHPSEPPDIPPASDRLATAAWVGEREQQERRTVRPREDDEARAEREEAMR